MTVNPFLVYAAQAGLAAGMFIAAGILSRIVWEERKER